MIDKLAIFKAQRRGFGTFLVHEEGTSPRIVGKVGYVDGMGDRWDDENEAVVGTWYHVIYEGVDAIYLMSDEDGDFIPDPPMTLQRKVQLLNEEDAYVASLEEEEK